MSERCSVVAKLVGFDIGMSDHGLCMNGHFSFDGYVQGIGYAPINGDFIARFMKVFGCESLQKVNGQSCWIEKDGEGLGSLIRGMRPLHKQDGERFDFADWAENRGRNE